MTVIEWDSETQLIRPGQQAPALVCVSYVDARSSEAPQLLDRADGLALFGQWLEQGVTFCGHSLSYDMAVIAAARPEYLPAIFQAYREDRAICTQLREDLIRTAMGTHRFEEVDGQRKKPKFDLAACAWRYARIELSKPSKKKGAPEDPDEWRLRYGLLQGVPVVDWPHAAQHYAKEDARATRAVRLGQQSIADGLIKQGFADILADQYRQARADFALRLASIWGLRADEQSVEALATNVGCAHEDLAKRLQEHGLVRDDGSRDMKAVSKMIYDAYTAEGKKVPRTKTWGPGKGELECVSTDADACAGADSPLLALYSKFNKLGALLSKDVPMLTAGVCLPIHTRFAFAVTGRSTSSGPNVQNFGGEGGVRECIVARPGTLILQLDMPGLELHTFSECATVWLGQSRMAELLNAGADVHSYVGAYFANVPYDDFLPHAEGKYKHFRKMAKPFNFGRLGAMGEVRFTDHARQKYDIRLKPGEYKAYNEKWLQALPEVPQWYRLANRRADYKAGKKATVAHLYSDRLRGDCGYTDACNTPFQGLGADLTKAVTFEIVSSCYDASRAGLLFGCRLLNYIHDEWLIEIPDDGYAHERAEALVDLVFAHANTWLKHVPFRREKFKPVLMRRWDKGAKQNHDTAGRLIAWE